MADKVADYAHGSTGVIENNGVSVNYTVVGDHVDENTSGGVLTGHSVGVNLSEEVSDVVIYGISLESNETNELYINGNKVDLNTLVLLGYASVDNITINNDGTFSGTSLSPTDGSITLNYSVDSVLVKHVGSGGDSFSFGLGNEAALGDAPCFTTGTLIETDQGPVAVETLKTGDMVRTKDHGFQPVKWVGASRVYASGFDVPLRIKKGTFGNTRDLVVSKRHKMLMDHTHLSLMFDVEEAFACAMHLRNDDTITREPEGWVTYYHILLPQHEVIFAEGAATESFYPDEGTLAGMAKGTREELLTHFIPETYGPQARPTLDPTRAMWIGRNLDILNGDDMGQIAAFEAWSGEQAAE